MTQARTVAPASAPVQTTVLGNEHAPAGEDSPLLGPETTRRDGECQRDGSLTDENEEEEEGDDDNVPKHAMSWAMGSLVVVGMAVLVLVNASNIAGMTVAQSTIAADLDAYASTTWFTSILLTVSSALTPLAARLAGIFSPTSLVLPATFFLALGSLVSGVAPSLGVFLAGRALVGVGSAGVLTLGMVLVLELASKRRRGLWVGVLHTGYTGGVAVGAVVFGSLLGVVGWRALLCAQTPLCLASGILVYATLPPSLSTPSAKDSTQSTTTWDKLARLDYLGAALLTLSFILFLSALADGSPNLVLLLSSACSLALFLLAEFHLASDPIIPLAVLSSRSALLACLAQMGIMSARWTVLYFTPLIALAVRGMHPSAAGSLLIPTNLGFSIGGIAVGWLHVRRSGSYWAATVVSVLLSATTLLALGPASASSAPVTAVVVVVFLNGFTTGAALTYTVAHALHLTSPDAHFVTTSLLTTFRTFGGSFGTALGGGVFFSTLRSELVAGFLRLGSGSSDDPSQLNPDHARLVEKLMGSPALVFSGDLGPAEQAVAVGGYEGAARSLFLAATALAVVSAAVQAGTGWQASVRKRT